MVIVWPSTSIETFEDAIRLAITTSDPIEIIENTRIELESTILIKTNSARITITGIGAQRPTLVSSGHSIFQIGGRNVNLVLNNLNLIHNCAREDYKDIGACIFALNLSKIRLSSCHLVSTHGFGIWCVQRASVSADQCVIESHRRSGCVAFGKSKLELNHCSLLNCGIHGACSRGNTQLILRGCCIDRAESRAIYAYHSVQAHLEDCIISGTKRHDLAAVDIFSSAPVEFHDSTETSSRAEASGGASEETPDVLGVPECNIDEDRGQNQDPGAGPRYKNGQGYTKHVVSDLNLKLLRCMIVNNNGAGLRIRGDERCKVLHEIADCVIDGNKGGNINIHETENPQPTRARMVPVQPKRGLLDEKQMFVWEYHVDDPHHVDECSGSGHDWRPYDSAVVPFLEENFQRYILDRQTGILGNPDAVIAKQYPDDSIQSSIVLLPAPFDDYEIDYEAMTQTKRTTFYSRSIRRRVAGVDCSENI